MTALHLARKSCSSRSCTIRPPHRRELEEARGGGGRGGSRRVQGVWVKGVEKGGCLEFSKL